MSKLKYAPVENARAYAWTMSPQQTNKEWRIIRDKVITDAEVTLPTPGIRYELRQAVTRGHPDNYGYIDAMVWCRNDGMDNETTWGVFLRAKKSTCVFDKLGGYYLIGRCVTGEKMKEIK